VSPVGANLVGGSSNLPTPTMLCSQLAAALRLTSFESALSVRLASAKLFKNSTTADKLKTARK